MSSTRREKFTANFLYKTGESRAISIGFYMDYSVYYVSVTKNYTE